MPEATRPTHPNYQAGTRGARAPQQDATSMRSLCPQLQSSPPALLGATRESPRAATKTQHSQKYVKSLNIFIKEKNSIW